MNRFTLLIPLLAACQLMVKTHGPGSSATSQPSHVVLGASGGNPDAGTGRMAGVRFDDIDNKVVAEAMGFARACFADYDDMRAKLDPIVAKHRARFDEIKKLDNYYAQRDALDVLVKAYIADVRAAKLDVAGATWNFVAKAGFAREIEGYLAALHRKRGITRTVKPFDSYYPPLADDTLAADVYCAAATLEGTHRTRAMSWLHFDGMLPKPRARALDAYLASRDKADDLAVAKTPPHYYTALALSTNISHHIDIETGSLLELGGTVESVRPGAHGVAIRVTQTGDASSQHDCVETNKVEAIEPDGRLRYRDVCQWSFSKSKVEFDLQFPDAPANLKPGDWIEFDAIVIKSVRGKEDPHTGAPKHMVFDLDGRLVRQVARAKKHGDSPSQFEVLASY
jgi:hypothetical protein